MKNRNPQKLTFSLLPVAIGTAMSLTISAIIFYWIVPLVMKTFILMEVRLENGTDTWEKWVNVRHKAFFKFHIFNVTNPDEADYGGKFKVQDIGPYTWEEKRTKKIISVNETDDTITYQDIVHYHFRPDLSVGSEDDLVNVVNMPLITASTAAFKVLYAGLSDFAVNMFMEGGEKFVARNQKVRELIWDGIQLGDLYASIASFGIVDLPEEFIDGTYAFYNGRNGTPWKEYTIDRGIKNPVNFGKILSYDGKKELPWWGNPSLSAEQNKYCQMLNGTDATIVAPFVKKDQLLYFYPYEIGRSVYAKFDKEINFDGVPAFVFAAQPKILLSPDLNPDNACFCTDPGHGLNNRCNVSGALRLFSFKNMPAVASFPHFLHGEQEFRDIVDGLYPDKDKHDMYLVVEPNTGAVLKVVKRIQISAEFQRIPGIEAFSNVSEALVPLFWAEEGAQISEADLNDIWLRLVIPLEIIKYLKPLSFAIITLGFLSALLLWKIRNNLSKPLLQMSEPNDKS